MNELKWSVIHESKKSMDFFYFWEIYLKFEQNFKIKFFFWEYFLYFYID